MARKGQFKKGGGRVGSGSSRRRARRTTTAIVVAAPRSVSRRRSAPRRVHRRARRRSGGSGGGINLLHLGIATAGLAFMTGDKSPIPTVRTMGAKIPGAATFGIPAAVGVGALAIDRFVKRNKWLKLLGCAGVVLAASKIGAQGTDFKWVGDDDDAIADIDGDDDVGEYDDEG